MTRSFRRQSHSPQGTITDTTIHGAPVLSQSYDGITRLKLLWVAVSHGREGAGWIPRLGLVTMIENSFVTYYVLFS